MAEANFAAWIMCIWQESEECTHKLQDAETNVLKAVLLTAILHPGDDHIHCWQTIMLMINGTHL